MSHIWTDFNLLFLFSALRCGFPGAPAHSTVEFSTPTVGPGTVARYTCDRGLELLGPARRMCGTNGTWVPQGIPFCGKICYIFTYIHIYTGINHFILHFIIKNFNYLMHLVDKVHEVQMHSVHNMQNSASKVRVHQVQM